MENSAPSQVGAETPPRPDETKNAPRSVTLRTYALAAVAARAYSAGAPLDETPEVRFLLDHLHAVAAPSPASPRPGAIA